MKTPLCDLLGIEVPIICAPFGPWDEVDSRRRGLRGGRAGQPWHGGPATGGPPRRSGQRLRSLTTRPFAINHTARPFDEAAFEATLAERPAADLVPPRGPRRARSTAAHDAGIRWIQQVTTLAQARAALAAGADVIVAQGSEAGGHSGQIGTLVLVPQVVDAAAGTPSSPRAASPTDGGWPPRSPSAPRVSASAPVSSPRPR